MILIRDIVIGLDDDEFAIKRKIAKQLHINDSQINKYEYAKKSIDARDKKSIVFIGSFYVCLDNESKIRFNNKIMAIDQDSIHPCIVKEELNTDYSPVVIGAGPCGLFNALYLARKGLKPILVEQGKCVEERTIDVEHFFATGELNPQSNIQFGEGGAGTYSDGKLTTSSNDVHVRTVLEEFVHFGAPKDILYLSKPHIGTDKLRIVVANIRKEIIQLGGKVHFETEFVGYNTNDGRLDSVIVKNKDGEETINTQAAFLCLGHSSRKTFVMLNEKQITMVKKPFAMGVRIEHLQEEINKAQYGDFYNHPRLGSADYKLIIHLPNERTVYTFCMCPGGEVVAASSELDGVALNGMSNYQRDSMFANSALLVNVTVDDIPGASPLSGIEFQRKYEQKVFQLAGGQKAIGQRVGDFLAKQTTSTLNRPSSFRPAITLGSIDDCLPNFICDSLRQAIPLLDKRLRGFANPDALLLGIESRSSSPIRIVRNEKYQSVDLVGLYPCGEGAGYAGGIVTSAVDGIKSAELFCNEVARMLE